MDGFSKITNNEYINLLKHYDNLRWKLIPLEGKQAYWVGWTNPDKWGNCELSNEQAINEIITSHFRLNVGIVTGELSKIIAIDVDQPRLLGWNPEPAIKKGALAHTTSKAPRILVSATNPELVAFNKKKGR